MEECRPYDTLPRSRVVMLVVRSKFLPMVFGTAVPMRSCLALIRPAADSKTSWPNVRRMEVLFDSDYTVKQTSTQVKHINTKINHRYRCSWLNRQCDYGYR